MSFNQNNFVQQPPQIMQFSTNQLAPHQTMGSQFQTYAPQQPNFDQSFNQFKPVLRVQLTNQERGFYSTQLATLDPVNQQSVKAKDAVQFFKRSGLDVQLLKQIWILASSNNESLNREEFYVALKLISYAQNNIEVSAESIMNNTPCPLPKFQPTQQQLQQQQQKQLQEQQQMQQYQLQLQLQQQQEQERIQKQQEQEKLHQEQLILQQQQEQEQIRQQQLLLQQQEFEKQKQLQQQQLQQQQLQQQQLQQQQLQQQQLQQQQLQQQQLQQQQLQQQQLQQQQLQQQQLQQQQLQQQQVQQQQQQQMQLRKSQNLMNQSINSSNSDFGESMFLITLDKQKNYEKYFYEYDVENKGCITAESAKEYMQKSKLPNMILSQVWQLTSRTSPGLLYKEEFVVATHLMMLLCKKQIESLPSALPQVLLEMIEKSQSFKQEKNIVDIKTTDQIQIHKQQDHNKLTDNISSTSKRDSIKSFHQNDKYDVLDYEPISDNQSNPKQNITKQQEPQIQQFIQQPSPQQHQNKLLQINNQVDSQNLNSSHNKTRSLYDFNEFNQQFNAMRDIHTNQILKKQTEETEQMEDMAEQFRMILKKMHEENNFLNDEIKKLENRKKQATNNLKNLLHQIEDQFNQNTQIKKQFVQSAQQGIDDIVQQTQNVLQRHIESAKHEQNNYHQMNHQLQPNFNYNQNDYKHHQNFQKETLKQEDHKQQDVHQNLFQQQQEPQNLDNHFPQQNQTLQQIRQQMQNEKQVYSEQVSEIQHPKPQSTVINQVDFQEVDSHKKIDSHQNLTQDINQPSTQAFAYEFNPNFGGNIDQQFDGSNVMNEFNFGEFDMNVKAEKEFGVTWNEFQNDFGNKNGDNKSNNNQQKDTFQYDFGF